MQGCLQNANYKFTCIMCFSFLITTVEKSQNINAQDEMTDCESVNVDGIDGGVEETKF